MDGGAWTLVAACTLGTSKMFPRPDDDDDADDDNDDAGDDDDDNIDDDDYDNSADDYSKND